MYKNVRTLEAISEKPFARKDAKTMYLMLLIFSAIVAILYNSGASYVANTSIAQKYSGSYAGKVGTLTVTFFLVLLVAGVLMNVVTKDSPLKA